MTDLTEHDIYLFREGTHFRAYDRLGPHLGTRGGEQGASFAVWAPNAQRVSVIGDFNDWQPGAHPLAARPDQSGIWQGFVPGARSGARYKFHIASRFDDFETEKADPSAYGLHPRHRSVPGT
jgi:1,4-alpha-glucan branching enzyme